MMKKMYLIAVLLASVTCAYADGDGCMTVDPDGLCGCASTMECIISVEENWQGSPDVTSEGPTDDPIFENTYENCACGDGNVSVSYTTEREHTVHVDLGVEVGSAVEASASVLAGSIKGSAHANVTLETGWSGSWTQTFTDNFEVPIAECNRKTYKVKRNKYTASGTIDYADCRFVYYISSSDNSYAGYCGKGTIGGDGQGWEGGTSGWYQESNCTSPNPPCGE